MKLLADLHVHSRASLDGRSSVEALIETARTRGLSCHHRLGPRSVYAAARIVKICF